MNILAVISSKGGVGKTSIALTAGFHYSRIMKQQTLLMELDSSPGDFSILFDIECNKSLEFAVKFPHNFQNYLKKVKENLFVLKGASDPFTAENIGSDEICTLLESVSTKYQNIIIDTQTVLSRLIIDVLKISAKIILLTDYSIESLDRSLFLYASLVHRHSVKKEKIILVVNRKRMSDFFRIWDFSRISGFPISGFISYDRNFDKNSFISGGGKVFSTKLYRQLASLIDSGFGDSRVRKSGKQPALQYYCRYNNRHKKDVEESEGVLL
ncbi:MAG: hypothetical protein FJW66_01615 [Actinobacteria bacterium]|nr:hypothetical protein [Actinomycetota bacterium]